MKTPIQTIALIVALAAPFASFAQSSSPVTRAEVREQLIQLEKAGYIPGATDAYAYPQNARAAEEIVAAKNKAPHSTCDGSAANVESQPGLVSKN